METVIKKGFSTRSASYVQSEVFWVICKLAQQINCRVLNRVISANIYVRSSSMMNGVGSEQVTGRIEKVDMNKRNRIVMLVDDHLVNGSPFKMGLEQYETLKNLCEIYNSLMGKYKLLEAEESRIQQVVKEVKPDFYNPQFNNYYE